VDMLIHQLIIVYFTMGIKKSGRKFQKHSAKYSILNALHSHILYVEDDLLVLELYNEHCRRECHETKRCGFDVENRSRTP